MILTTELVKLLVNRFLGLVAVLLLLISFGYTLLPFEIILRPFLFAKVSRGVRCSIRFFLLCIFYHHTRICVGLAYLAVVVLQGYGLYRSGFWL